MRFVYPLLMFLALGIVLAIFVSENLKADPNKTMGAFVDAVRSGDYRKAVNQFGGNACRCPAKGGWVSYLIYSSSQEPNLAFMTGHPFEYKAGAAKPIESSDEAKKGSVPWEAPQDVVIDVAIKFDSNKYRPLFLPVFMAYGKEMSEAEFEAFLKDPDAEAWKGFTLRLRPSLVKGAIERPEASKGIKYNPTESLGREPESKDKAKTGKEENYVYAPMEDMIRETLGEEGVLYLHPRDPGTVLKEDGSKLAPSKIEERLPRLSRCNLRMHVVRRGQLKQWTVYHVAITDPVLETADGQELVLDNYRPRYDNDKWNPRD